MQMSKTLLACGAVAFSLVALKASAADTATDAKLREALHQKMEEMNKPAAPAQAAAPAARPATPAPTSESPAAAPVVVTQEGAVAPPAAQDDAQTARLRAALREALTSTPPPAESAPAPAASGTAASLPAEMPAPAIMTAPPLPISATKEERLETLLQLYKADRITPMEYHERRAKILAE